MPVGLREIKRSIRSVKNTQQIAKAMEMVAAARLKRTQARLSSIRKYSYSLHHAIVLSLGSLSSGFKHSFLAQESGERAAKLQSESFGVMIFSADRGLCGAYNGNLNRFALQFLNKKNPPLQIKIIGRKALSFFRKTAYRDIVTPCALPNRPTFESLGALGQEIVADFEKRGLSSYYFIYTKFLSTSRHMTVAEKVVPVEQQKARGEPRPNAGREVEVRMIFEPKPDLLLNSLLPAYITAKTYEAYIESQTAEQAARMIAMQSAGKNAGEMIDSLTLQYNKARQAGITKELLEVVSGAEALK